MRSVECPATDCGSVNVICEDREFALFRCQECGMLFDEDDAAPADMRLQAPDAEDDEF